MANTSVFTKENGYQVDVFQSVSTLPPDKYQDAQTLQNLMGTINKTSDQISQMNTLLVELAPYYISPQTWTHLCDCIHNVEGNYLVIYNDFIATVNAQLAKIAYKSQWNAITNYQQWNIVAYNGQAYLAKNDNIGVTPGSINDTSWALIAAKGEKGDKGDKGDDGAALAYKGSFNPNTQYYKGETVEYLGNEYGAIDNPPLGTYPTNTTYWNLFLAKGLSTVSKFLPNTTILSSPSSNVTIGISAFNKDTDSLIVHKQGQFLTEGQQFEIASDGLSINSEDGSPWSAGSIFDFIVLKNVTQDMSYTDGGLIANGTITLPKLSTAIQTEINKIGSVTLNTTSQDLSGATNEIYNSVTTHIGDTIKHIPRVTTTHSGNSYAVTTSLQGDIPDQYTMQVKFDSASTDVITLNLNGKGAKNVIDFYGNQVKIPRNNLITNIAWSASDDSFILLGKGGGGTATPDQVLAPNTFTNNNGVQTGIMSNNGAINGTITTQNGSITIPNGYTTGGSITANFANLIASNIKDGINIGGVVGNLTVSSLGGSQMATGFIPSSNPMALTIDCGFQPDIVIITQAYDSYDTYANGIKVNNWYRFNNITYINFTSTGFVAGAANSYHPFYTGSPWYAFKL